MSRKICCFKNIKFLVVVFIQKKELKNHKHIGVQEEKFESSKKYIYFYNSVNL